MSGPMDRADQGGGWDWPSRHRLDANPCLQPSWPSPEPLRFVSVMSLMQSQGALLRWLPHSTGEGELIPLTFSQPQPSYVLRDFQLVDHVKWNSAEQMLRNAALKLNTQPLVLNTGCPSHTSRSLKESQQRFIILL